MNLFISSPLNASLLSLTALTLGALSLSTGCGGDGSGVVGYGEIAPSDERISEVYDEVVENDFVDASQQNTSTFSVDVDTASYTVMRRDVQSGRLPLPQSVRPEEYINFFDYAYPEPVEGAPFSVHMEVAPSKFGEGLHMMRVGVRGKQVKKADMKPTNIVFLVDVSGSMSSREKSPLVQESIKTLVDNLRDEDTISIVTYAGADRVILEPTQIKKSGKIRRALRRLKRAGGIFGGGSTNAEAGIVTAYKLAEQAKKTNGNNRVILLTDGDFNVGKTGEELIAVIEDYRAKEISLTCMGYGLGDYNDYHMENLSNRGNGNYFYVDSVEEAERVFGSQLTSTLEVIAADVKIQVEFNQDVVTRYRLLGYENRVLENDDFDDDAVDAGEIGPGHTVTAYYELELGEDAPDASLLSTVRLRHKSQYGEDSELLERAIKLSGAADSFEAASDDFRFGAAVAEYAEILRGSMHVDAADLQAVHEVASGASQGEERQREFLELVETARGLR